MISIVNVSENWGIGKDGDLLEMIPEDMRFFRETTRGKVVVMGRKTLDSFPDGRPLKGRANIVITRNVPAETAVNDGGTQLLYASSVEEAAGLSRKTAAERGQGEGDIFVIGGASIYSAMLPYCDTAYVTVNDSEKVPDTFFPDLDSDPEWELREESEVKTLPEKGLKYRFCKYVRKAK